MTDRGDFIEVDASEVEPQFPALLKAVEEGGRTVRVLRGGKAVAQISPPESGESLPLYPELAGVVFNGNPTAPLDEEDWPGESR